MLKERIPHRDLPVLLATHTREICLGIPLEIVSVNFQSLLLERHRSRSKLHL